MRPGAYLLMLRYRVRSIYGFDSDQTDRFWRASEHLFRQCRSVEDVKRCVRNDPILSTYGFFKISKKRDQGVLSSSISSPA